MRFLKVCKRSKVVDKNMLIVIWKNGILTALFVPSLVLS